MLPISGDDGDGGVVLGGGAHHGGAADVDLLDAGVEGGTGGDGVGEGVEVDDDEVDGGHAQGPELVEMLGLAAVGEDTPKRPRPCPPMCKPGYAASWA